MKKIIRKIKMWYWKHTDPDRYYRELYDDVFQRFGEGIERLKTQCAAFSAAAYKFGERTKTK